MTRVFTWGVQTVRPRDVLNRHNVGSGAVGVAGVASGLAANAAVRDAWLVQGFGLNESLPDYTGVTGLIFRHPDDALDDSLRPGGLTNDQWDQTKIATPWHTVGTEQWLGVTEAILDLYPALSPPPRYIVADTEQGVYPLSFNFQVPLAYSLAKQFDPRWGEAEIFAGMTMATLTKEVPDPGDPTLSWANAANQDWAKAVFGIYLGAMSWAMCKSHYEPIRNRFGDVKCGNYSTDQVGDGLRWNSRPFLSFRGYPFGQMVCPVLYSIDPDMLALYEAGDEDEALLKHTSYMVRRMAGKGPFTVCPWILAPDSTNADPALLRTQEYFQAQRDAVFDAGGEFCVAWGEATADFDLTV